MDPLYKGGIMNMVYLRVIPAGVEAVPSGDKPSVTDQRTATDVLPEDLQRALPGPLSHRSIVTA